jgi:hypothetical protein
MLTCFVRFVDASGVLAGSWSARWESFDDEVEESRKKIGAPLHFWRVLSVSSPGS